MAVRSRESEVVEVAFTTNSQNSASAQRFRFVTWKLGLFQSLLFLYLMAPKNSFARSHSLGASLPTRDVLYSGRRVSTKISEYRGKRLVLLLEHW